VVEPAGRQCGADTAPGGDVERPMRTGGGTAGALGKRRRPSRGAMARSR